MAQAAMAPGAPLTPLTAAAAGEAAGDSRFARVPGTPTARLSMNDAAAAIGERLRARAAPGGEASPPDSARNRPASAGQNANAGDSSPRPAADPAADPADPFGALMSRLRGDDAPAPTPAAPGLAPPPTPAPAKANGESYTLDVEGQPQTFTGAELAQHLAKSKDYTAKTQQISALARELNDRQAALAEVLPLVLPYMERMIAETEGGLGAAPDWVKLAETDPGGYIAQKARWDMAQAERQKLDRIRQSQARESDHAKRLRLAEGHKTLVQSLPGWDDPAKRTQMQGLIANWAKKQGYPDQEIGQVYESRHVVTLAKAMLFDRMLSGAKTDAPRLPHVPRGGLQRPAEGELQTAEERFAARPNAANAGALISARRRGR
jgi:hypothetical protein